MPVALSHIFSFTVYARDWWTGFMHPAGLSTFFKSIDTSCAFETNDLNLTTANFDGYGNVSFDPCEFTLHTAANAENNNCSKKLV
jgi:hypothetical protein